MIRVVGGPKRPELAELTIEPIPPEMRAVWDRVHEEHRRNAHWFEERALELFAKYPGQFVCVADGDLFAGPDAKEVLARAKAAHPDLPGAHHFRYIPLPGQSRQV